MNTVGYDLANQKRETIISALQDISALIGEPGRSPVTLEAGDSILPGLGFIDDATTLINRAKDIQQGIFKTLVLGEFKNGKSTLLNSMLGDKILIAKAAPATAIITILLYGEGQDVVVYYKNKEEPRVLTLEAFKKGFELTKEDSETLEDKGYVDRFEDVAYAQMECHHRFCENGVRLIDSPGLGEQLSRTKVTTSYLEQSNAVIFVLNATQILSEPERDFIKNKLEGHRNNIFFIVNFINRLDNEDDVNDIKTNVKQFLKYRFLDKTGNFDQDFYNRRVFFVNAKGALDARSKTPIDTAMLEDSNVPALEKELERFLTSDEKVAAAFESTAQNLTNIVDKVHRKIIEEKLSLDKPLNELEQNRAETEVMLKDLEKKKKDIEKTILTLGEMIAHKVYANLISYLNEMNDTWKKDSERLIKLDEVSLPKILFSVVSKEAKENMAKAIEREIKKYLEVKLGEWSNKVPIVIKEDVNNMMAEIEAQVDEFQLELDRIGNIFSGGKVKGIESMDQNKGKKIFQLILGFGDLSQMTGIIMGKGDWTSFFGRMVQQIIAVLLVSTFFSGGIAAIVFLVIEALHMKIQKEGFKKRLLDGLGAKLHENLLKKLSEKQNEIYESIMTQFAQLAQQITQKLQNDINETRSQQEGIIRQKKDKTFSVDQEKRRLDKIGDKVLALFNMVNMEVYGKSLTSEELNRLVEGKSLLVND